VWTPKAKDMGDVLKSLKNADEIIVFENFTLTKDNRTNKMKFSNRNVVGGTDSSGTTLHNGAIWTSGLQLTRLFPVLSKFIAKVRAAPFLHV
jgi:hypothetical protein